MPKFYTPYSKVLEFHLYPTGKTSNGLSTVGIPVASFPSTGIVWIKASTLLCYSTQMTTTNRKYSQDNCAK